MNISRWPPNLLKFHLLTHGCQLDVIKASNYVFFGGKPNSNIRNRNLLLNKLVSSDILIIHCKQEACGPDSSTIYIQLSG